MKMPLVVDRSGPRLPESLPSLAKRIRAEHAAVGAAISKGIAHAMAAGEMLILAKRLCDHGEWLPWLEKNCPEISVRQAQKYMQVASHREELANAPSGAHLGINEALAAIAPSDPKVNVAAASKCAPEGAFETAKYTLPRGIRDLVLGKDIPCPAPVLARLTATDLNDFYSRTKAKDLCGLEAKEADELRRALRHRYFAAAAAAAERDGPSKLLAADYKRWISQFSDECVDTVQAWWIQHRRAAGTKPFFTLGCGPSDVEAPVYYAVLVVCQEFIRGPREGASLFDGFDGLAVESAATTKKPPTLTNKRVDAKPKASGCPSPELAMSALARLRLDQKLAKVRNFPPQVAGALSMRGIRTVRELLQDAQDLATQVVRVLESTDHATHAARCIKALRTYLDIRDQQAA